MNLETQQLGLHPPLLPRKRKIPKRLEGTLPEPSSFTDVKMMYNKYFTDALDSLTREIDYRFSQPGFKQLKQLESVVLDWEIIHKHDQTTNYEPLCKLYEWDKDTLKTQLDMMKQILPQRYSSVQDLIVAFKTFHSETQQLFPDLVQVLKTLKVIPASSASAERSFSLLRRLKSRTRTTMTQQRLNNMAILNCYPEYLDKVKLQKIAQEFIYQNEKRRVTFGSFPA